MIELPWPGSVWRIAEENKAFVCIRASDAFHFLEVFYQKTNLLLWLYHSGWSISHILSLVHWSGVLNSMLISQVWLTSQPNIYGFYIEFISNLCNLTQAGCMTNTILVEMDWLLINRTKSGFNSIYFFMWNY